MNQRTMVKISAEENVITLRTFSREYRSPQGFIILRSDTMIFAHGGYI